VALSRCRTLSGMVLRNPIAANNIIGDPAVIRYNTQAQNLPDLDLDRERYATFLLSELFNFSGLKNRLKDFENLVDSSFLVIAEKTVRQLKLNEPERIRKAAEYFYKELTKTAESLHVQIPALIGTSKEGAAKADQLLGWIMARISLMEHFTNTSFSVSAYLNAPAIKPAHIFVKALNAKPNEKLYQQILEWRKRIAANEKLMPNGILSERAAATIAEKLPATIKALGAIKGVGPQKATQYGTELIQMIRTFQTSEKEQGSLF